MTISREEAQNLLDNIVGVTPNALPLVKDLLSSVIALHAAIDRLKADAGAAVALVVEKAAGITIKRTWTGVEWADDMRLAHKIRALADTDALAEVQALCAERDAGWKEARYQEARRKTAEARVAGLVEAGKEWREARGRLSLFNDNRAADFKTDWNRLAAAEDALSRHIAALAAHEAQQAKENATPPATQ